MTYRIKLRLILWSILALAVGWLLYMGIVPGGSIIYTSNFKSHNYFIRKLTPTERVLTPSGGEQSIVGDPAYFTVRTPRAFAHAKVTLKYKNPDKIPIIEVGVLSDKQVWRYQTKPIQNLNLEKLSTSWPLIQEGQTVLLQKEKKFTSIEEFLKRVPSPRAVAVYNFALSVPFKIEDYKAASTTVIFDYPVRGAFQFYTYIKNETLFYRLLVDDLNLNKDSDTTELKLWQGAKLINSVKLPDDNVNAQGKITKNRELIMEIKRLPEAAYRLELVANDDIVINRIVTSQNKLTFINKIWFADSSKKPIVLETDSQEVNVQTLNPAKLSTVNIGTNKLLISETYQQYSAVTNDNITSIVLPENDIVVSGDGVFSVAEDNFINPSFEKVGPIFFPDKRGIKYVIANYTPPKNNEDGWQVGEAELDLGQAAYREFFKYNFMISAPGLKAEEFSQRKLILKEIKMEFSGSSLWEKISKLIYAKQ